MRNSVGKVWTIPALAALLLMAHTNTVHAAKASKEENIGIGSGAVVGAIAGGPVGFIVGAAIGAKIGDSIHHKNNHIDTLNASLDQRESDVVDLERDLRDLSADVNTINTELAHAQQFVRPELVNMMQSGISLDVSFRTGEYRLADANGARLAEFAAALAAVPNVRIHLDGFADERGDADYNHELSEKRIEFVRGQLLLAGIDAAGISSVAHGEAAAQDDSPDSYALERRVNVTVFLDDKPAVAATQ